MIPSAKIDALANAPPENMFNRPSNPLFDWVLRLVSISGSTPGRTM
jgi:hypothetical protein